MADVEIGSKANPSCLLDQSTDAEQERFNEIVAGGRRGHRT
jgi:hypothetical protein